MEPIEIDGRDGEGGGQVVRTSVALAAITGRPLRIIRARAGRKKPGLQAQHLTAVKAVATVCEAETEGLRLGAERFRFTPGAIRGGRFTFSVPTAGSAGLVLHAVLPPLLRAPGPSEVVFEGGTHVRAAPPFEHLEQAFLPALREMGIEAELELSRPGFFPKGGGRMVLQVQPWTEPRPFLRDQPLSSRASVVGRAHVGKLPEHVAERVERRLRFHRVEMLPPVEGGLPSPGPGLAVCLTAGAAGERDVVTALGERGLPAEEVVDAAVGLVRAHLAAGVPVGPYLADQLLLYMALGAGGRFLTVAPTRHFETQVRTLARFLGSSVDTRSGEGGKVEVIGEVGARVFSISVRNLGSEVE